MQVLFLAKWYPNKLDPFDGNFIENHAHALSKIAQIKVLFVHSDSSLQKGYQIEEKTNKEIKELRVFFPKANTGIPFLDKVITFFRYRKAQKLGYKKLYPSSKPDLIHVHVLSRPALLALQLNIPFIITEHWSGYLPANGNYKGLLKKLFTSFVVKKAKGIHTVSTQLKEAMEAHQLHNKYWVVPNVVDTNLFTIQNLKQEKEKCIILYVGNLFQSHKKIFDIIRSAAQLHEHHSNFELHLYGEGENQKEAIELIQELNAKEYILLKGTRDRAGIAEAMANASFLVLFSQFENQPCVIPESHAVGIPIIVPALPGIAERMNDQLGIMVPVGDQKAFYIAMKEMLANHANYSKESIRKYAIENFSEEVIAEKFKEIYQEALAVE